MFLQPTHSECLHWLRSATFSGPTILRDGYLFAKERMITNTTLWFRVLDFPGV